MNYSWNTWHLCLVFVSSLVHWNLNLDIFCLILYLCCSELFRIKSAKFVPSYKLLTWIFSALHVNQCLDHTIYQTRLKLLIQLAYVLELRILVHTLVPGYNPSWYHMNQTSWPYFRLLVFNLEMFKLKIGASLELFYVFLVLNSCKARTILQELLGKCFYKMIWMII